MEYLSAHLPISSLKIGQFVADSLGGVSAIRQRNHKQIADDAEPEREPDLFAKLPEKPTIQQESEWKDTLPMFGASKVPEREGHGYEYPVSFNTSNVESWLTNLVRGL